jgi:hypothetical protein
VHPSKDELRKYVDSQLGKSDREQIRKHLNECELCRIFCEDYKDLAVMLQSARNERMRASTLKLGQALFQTALKHLNINLIPLKTEIVSTRMKLAADGSKADIKKVRNIATLYSEDPEVILRVMRNLENNRDYFQLISDNENFISNVMVRIPELGCEFITDENGYSNIEEGFKAEYEQTKWQIKMPAAIFDLDPLKYDPETTEYAEEVIIETESRDKILVTFEGKTKGKQISLSILQLNGQVDFGTIKVHITQKGLSKTEIVTSHDKISFTMASPQDEIKVRLFQ